MAFQSCATNSKADCKGPALCNSAPPDCANPACNAQYVISYANNSDNPPASAQISYTLSDGNTGSQGTGATPGIASGSITVNITAVNDAPVLSGLTPTVAVTPATPVVTLSPGALASDDPRLAGDILFGARSMLLVDVVAATRVG